MQITFILATYVPPICYRNGHPDLPKDSRTFLRVPKNIIAQVGTLYSILVTVFD